jgi:hypothetical protein
MGMTAKLWSLNALSVETGRNPRTIAHALRHTAADGELPGRHKGWLLTTALAALAAYERNSDQLGHGAHRPSGDETLDQIEAAARRVDEMLVRLRREPDVGRRREILKQEGGIVGALDRAFAADFDRQGEKGRLVFQPFADNVMRQTIAEITELCEYKLAG